MEIVSRRRAGPSEETCERCGHSLPRDAFGQSEKLAGSRFPWCVECVEGIGDDAAARVAYQRSYQQSYMRRRRGDAKTRWLTITVQGHGRMLARWSALRREIRITGPFALREDAYRILAAAFGATLKDITEHGQGGGRGVRRQKTFSSRAPVEQQAWERGRDLLVAEGLARVGKGGT